MWFVSFAVKMVFPVSPLAFLAPWRFKPGYLASLFLVRFGAMLGKLVNGYPHRPATLWLAAEPYRGARAGDAGGGLVCRHVPALAVSKRLWTSDSKC